jgi:hypothetical protein
MQVQEIYVKMDPRLFDLDGRMLTPRLLAETKAL